MSEWEKVGNDRKTIQASKMTIGGSFSGKLVAIEQATKTKFTKRDKDGNELPSFTLIFAEEDGSEFLVYPAGTLNFKIKDEQFVVGRTYRVTRLENKPTKAGNSRTDFEVLVKRLDGSIGAGPAENNSKPAGKSGKK